MSTGPRIPLARAEAAAELLMREWKMNRPACAVVGSVRRQKPDVGDIEFIAPLPEDPKKDSLFDAIAETLPAEGLFSTRVPFAKAVRGVERGFKAASLVCQLKGVGADGGVLEVPVQIFRYHTGEGASGEHCNRGWVEIMRTGPDDFGRWFLSKWKARFGIPHDEAHPASVKGQLVDSYGTIVPVLSEEQVFAKLGIPFIPPNDRTEFVELQRRRASVSRELLA